MNILSGLLSRQYTIRELMQIDVGRQGRATNCIVKLDKVYHELKRETIADKVRSFFTGKPIITMYYLIFKFTVLSGTGHTYTVYIRTNPDFSLKNWADSTVKIYCDCPDFKYRSAYQLNKRNSLFKTPKIVTELGPALTDAPKRGTTLLCKHSFAALSWLMNNWTNVMKTI